MCVVNICAHFDAQPRAQPAALLTQECAAAFREHDSLVSVVGPLVKEPLSTSEREIQVSVF